MAADETPAADGRGKPAVLFVARNVPLPGLPENNVVLEIARRLNRRYDISVVVPVAWLPPLPPGRSRAAMLSRLPRHVEFSRGLWGEVLRYLRLPGLSLSYLAAGTLRANRFVRRRLRRYDLIHAHYVLPDGYLGWLAKTRYGTPFVLSVRHGDVMKLQRSRGPVRRLYRRVLQAADRLLAYNAADAACLAGAGLEAAVIPHGLAPHEVLPTPRQQTATGRVAVLTVCRLEAFKRIDWCIRALNEYDGPEAVCLTVVGDGPEAERLRALPVTNPRLTVAFAGRCTPDEVLAHYRRSDVFVMPSEHETFGRVYLEAIANGCATVLMEGTGLDGCFAGDREVLVSPPAYSGFRACLHRLLSDADLRDRLARAGRERAAAEFTWDAVMPAYTHVYERLLASRGAGGLVGARQEED